MSSVPYTLLYETTDFLQLETERQIHPRNFAAGRLTFDALEQTEDQAYLTSWES